MVPMMAEPDLFVREETWDSLPLLGVDPVEADTGTSAVILIQQDPDGCRPAEGLDVREHG
jgi:hypothetical protein